LLSEFFSKRLAAKCLAIYWLCYFYQNLQFDSIFLPFLSPERK